MKRIGQTSLLALCAGVLSLTGQKAEVVRYEVSHEAMGTVFTVVAYGRDRNYLAEVVDEVFDEVDRLDGQMSNYKPESELSGINREAGSRDVVVEPKLFHLLEDSSRYSRDTDGAFDITVGPLMKDWGFFRGRGRLPSPAEIAEVLRRVGYRHVMLDPDRRTVRFDTNGVELDLGGIAKGYAVDRAVEILRSNGISAALVSSGTSSIYALGSPPNERGWTVRVRDPYDPNKVGDVVHLQNYSLSTSGSYEKFFRFGDKIYCHIMDPRTGWPVGNMLSTAVLAPSTTQSDALSKPFFLWGPAGSRRYLAAHANLAVVFYEPAGKPHGFTRTILCSDSFQIPSDQIAEVVK
jgi:thiamine biosynthesis lipoprotein